MVECCAALKASPGVPPEEALRPVIERHWEKEFRPQLLTEFAKVCLVGEQKVSQRPDSAAATAAAGWLREAAEKGHAPAQMRLGELYVQGLGVASDPQEAAKWMRQAAAQNYPHAACRNWAGCCRPAWRRGESGRSTEVVPRWGAGQLCDR